jgi:hypothetical protein
MDQAKQQDDGGTHQHERRRDCPHVLPSCTTICGVGGANSIFNAAGEVVPRHEA